MKLRNSALHWAWILLSPAMSCAWAQAPLTSVDATVVNEVIEVLPPDAASEPQPHNVAAFENLMVNHIKTTMTGLAGVSGQFPVTVSTLRVAEKGRVLHKTVLDIAAGRPGAARLIVYWGFRGGQLRRVQCLYKGAADNAAFGNCAAQMAKTFEWPGWPAY